eukprot:6318481-Prymnesium_polylepis.2
MDPSEHLSLRARAPPLKKKRHVSSRGLSPPPCAAPFLNSCDRTGGPCRTWCGGVRTWAP